jgi:hypothetical protein
MFPKFERLTTSENVPNESICDVRGTLGSEDGEYMDGCVVVV